MSDYTPDTETVREQYTREQPPHIGTVSEKRAEFNRWLHEVRMDERERITLAIVDELARTTATARPEACEYANEGYCHTEAREQALEDAARIAREGARR